MQTYTEELKIVRSCCHKKKSIHVCFVTTEYQWLLSSKRTSYIEFRILMINIYRKPLFYLSETFENEVALMCGLPSLAAIALLRSKKKGYV